MNRRARPGETLPDALGGLSLRALISQGSAGERVLVLGGWLLTLVASALLAQLAVRHGWAAHPIELAGRSVYLTTNPIFAIGLWWTLCFGWRWGALPTYLCALVLAVDAGMPPGWALLFAAANPIGLAVLSLGYRAVDAPRAMRSFRAWTFFVPLCFVAAIFSSVGALLWTHLHQMPARDQLPVWQGWWLGAFLQSVLVTGPLMALTWPTVHRWMKRRRALLEPPPEGRRALGLGLLLSIVLALIGFGGASLGLGSLQLRAALHSGQWTALTEATSALLGTAWIFFWVCVLIALFVAQFGYQALSRWMRKHEALVAQLAHLASELDQRSRTDGLTGLSNRAAAEEGLRGLLRAARRYRTPAAVLMLDIDHFKQVNDRYGHAAGDAVIRALARTLCEASRDVDLPGRFGGEEFVVGLAHTDLRGAQRFAERLRASVAASSVNCDGQTLTYTISVGVALMTSRDADLDAVLRRADEALYRAKAAGRNRIELAPVPRSSRAQKRTTLEV